MFCFSNFFYWRRKGFTGCDGSAEKIAATGNNVLRVGTEPIFAPFEFPKEGNQGYTGFDIELMEAIGKQMGKK